MGLVDSKFNAILYSVEGVGAAFVIIFLAAYLGGLPTTNVLHNQPEFRIPLAFLGALLLILVLVSVIMAAWHRTKKGVNA
jgi:CHASE1-domain containing sensor protein